MTVRQNIFIFLRGVEASRFIFDFFSSPNLQACSLLGNLNVSECGERKILKEDKLTVIGAHAFYNREGAQMRSRAVVLDVLDFFFLLFFLEIWDMGFVPSPPTPGELPLRYPVGLFGTFFSKSRAKLSS